jgi:glycosyltransferase involved in cell wall biosynthesis
MAKKLIEILGDKKKAAAMGEKGRRRIAESFSAETQLSKILRLYNELLAK